VEILKRLLAAVPGKRPEIWPNDWILPENNVPACKTLSVKQFLNQKQFTEKKHPPCYPGLAPSDFLLFPKIYSALKVRRFQDGEDIEKK
jgi:hypothetical protein